MSESPLLFQLLIAFGAFQGIFISIIFLSDRRASFPKRLFAGFLVIEGITLVERLLVEVDLIHHFPHLLGVSYPLNFIKPPIMLFMAVSVANQAFRWRKIHLLHAIPFCLILMMNIPFYFETAEFKIELAKAFVNYTPTYKSFDFYLFFSFYVNIGIYIALSIKTLRKYRQLTKNNQLANWYLQVLYLYSGSLVIGFAYFVIRPSGVIDIPLINTISMLIMTFLVQSIAYKFFSKPSMFIPKTNYVRNNLDQLVKDEITIKQKLENDKPYLEETLNLEGFAASLSMSKKYVSYVINQRFGSTFKDLIHQYRIEEAKRLMEENNGLQTSLIAIAEESGYNNKVSFYRAFKKYTGKSPSDYLNNIKRDLSKNGQAVDQ